MFGLFKPDDSVIGDFISKLSHQSFSYEPVGGTATYESLNGFTVDHNRVRLGNGPADWERAKTAVTNWKMFDFAWVDLYWPGTPIRPLENVAILVRHLGFYSLNGSRIVYTIDEPDRFGFAYGTLNEHGESGEERFSVEKDPDSGDIWYDLYAFSRPNYFVSKLGYPFTRHLQKQFAIESKKAMLTAVSVVRPDTTNK